MSNDIDSAMQEVAEAIVARDKTWIQDEVSITYQPAEYNPIVVTKKGGATVYFLREDGAVEREQAINLAREQLRVQLRAEAWSEMRFHVREWYKMRDELAQEGLNNAALQRAAETAPKLPPANLPKPKVSPKTEAVSNVPAGQRAPQHFDRAPRASDRVPGDTWEEVANEYLVTTEIETADDGSVTILPKELHLFVEGLQRPLIVRKSNTLAWPSAWFDKGLKVDGKKYPFTKRVVVQMRVSDKINEKTKAPFVDVVSLTSLG